VREIDLTSWLVFPIIPLSDKNNIAVLQSAVSLIRDRVFAVYSFPLAVVLLLFLLIYARTPSMMAKSLQLLRYALRKSIAVFGKCGDSVYVYSISEKIKEKQKEKRKRMEDIVRAEAWNDRNCLTAAKQRTAYLEFKADAITDPYYKIPLRRQIAPYTGPYFSYLLAPEVVPEYIEYPGIMRYSIFFAFALLLRRIRIAFALPSHCICIALAPYSHRSRIALSSASHCIRIAFASLPRRIRIVVYLHTLFYSTSPKLIEPNPNPQLHTQLQLHTHKKQRASHTDPRPNLLSKRRVR
jgi:hypothetical protein